VSRLLDSHGLAVVPALIATDIGPVLGTLLGGIQEVACVTGGGERGMYTGGD